MEGRVTKQSQFLMALARLKEAIAECEGAQSEVMRDGVIQRFEFTCELAWKSCREKLLDEGFVGIDSPKSAMRQAYASGWIADERGWLNLLQARNLTSHMYSAQQAEEIYLQIRESYVPLFELLSETLKK